MKIQKNNVSRETLFFIINLLKNYKIKLKIQINGSRGTLICKYISTKNKKLVTFNVPRGTLNTLYNA